MKLTLTVELANASMQRYGDAADAIAATLMRGHSEFEIIEADAGGIVMDVNGNTVGAWEVTNAE